MTRLLDLCSFKKRPKKVSFDAVYIIVFFPKCEQCSLCSFLLMSCCFIAVSFIANTLALPVCRNTLKTTLLGVDTT